MFSLITRKIKSKINRNMENVFHKLLNNNIIIFKNQI